MKLNNGDIMDSVEELLTKKRKYETLKANINSIIIKLTSAIENLETPVNKIKSAYSIDSGSIDGSQISVVRQNLINKKNYLTNTVLYTINKDLKEIKEKIESAG